MKSPLADLTEILTRVREDSQRYADTLAVNEASTRAVLIDPILRALGWDTGDPYMVEVEKTFLKARADYALLDINQEVKAIVEAKCLGASLKDKDVFLSLVNYAFSAGVQDIFLTDGVTWLHFSDFKPGKSEPTKELSLLDEESLVEIASYLVQRLDAARYWPEGKDVEDLAQQISQLKSEISSIQLSVAKLTQGTKATLDQTEAPAQGQGNFVNLEVIGQAKGTRPSLLRLPDGTSVSANTWSDVLTQCCQYAMDHNPQITLPFKDAAGKKVNLFSLTRPPKQISYYEADYQGQHIFVYTNYDSNNCIRNSIHVLKQVGKANILTNTAVVFGT